MNGERAALSRRALDRHSPTVRRDNPLDEAQPEPSALNLRGDDVGGTVERFEDARLICCVDPDAAVGDGDADLAARWSAADANRLATGAVLDRVVNQVLEDAPQRRLVAQNRRQVVGNVELHDQPGCLDQRRRRRDDIADQWSDADRPQRKPPLTRLNAGKLQNLLDHLGQPPAFGAHQLAIPSDSRLVVDHAVGQVLSGGSNDSQGRAQLV